MKILHVIPSLNPESGGPGRSIPGLCRALAESGVDVTLYSTHFQGGSLTINPQDEPYEVRLWSSSAGRAGAAYAIYRAVKESAGRFELIHIHSVWNSVVTMAAAGARAAGVPYILAPRGMLDEVCLSRRRALKRLCAAAYEKRTVEGAALLHFLNAAEARSSNSSWFRYPNYFIAPNGIDLNLHAPEPGAFRRAHRELEGRKIMLFMGRLHPIKGLYLQLQALEILVKQHPELMWVLIGPDEGEWPRVKEGVEAKKLTAHVRWLGPLPGAERFRALKDADVAVQTSLYECHSMTVNEALAVGTPLVITDTVHFDEVESSGAGLVVPREAEAFARAVRTILQAPDGGERLRAAGRLFARRHLSWSESAGKLKAVYDRVICGSQNAPGPQPDVLDDTVFVSSN